MKPGNAGRAKGCRFNALMGLLFDPEGLHASFERQAGKKAPGVTRCGRLELGAESARLSVRFLAFRELTLVRNGFDLFHS